MKHTMLYLGMAMGLALAVPAAVAADTAAPKAPAAKKADAKKKADSKKKDSTEQPAAGNVVGEALKTVNFVTPTLPRYDAKFYLYLTSAGWCGPCNREMPNIVKQYPEMLKKDMQLILVSADQQVEAATHFMKRNRGDFPCIMGNPTTESAKLPGYVDTHAVPQAIIVDAAGTVLAKGPAQGIIASWQKIIKKK
ncbi:MAG: redoxin domain-containing protein [Akkermansia sp.]|nr:redoxin domain-containing protein [Akkermansia sp.]